MSQFSHIPLELNYSEAMNMDSLYYDNKSVRKRSSLLNTLSNEYTTDQVLYLVILFIEDLISDDSEKDYKKINQLLSLLNFESINFQTVLSLLTVLKPIHHNLQNFKNFHKECKKYFDSQDFDSGKIFKDLGY